MVGTTDPKIGEVLVGGADTPASLPRTFDPSTPGTRTGGIQEALRTAGGRPVRFQRGSYSPAVPVNIPAGSTLLFDGATFRPPPGGPLFQAGQQNDLTFRGTLRFLGHGGPANGINLAKMSGLDVRIEAMVTGLARHFPFLNIFSSQNLRIGGHLSTQDSKLITVSSCSHADISGADVHATVDLNIAPISVVAFRGETYQDVHVHDCVVDGGGLLTGPGLVARVEPGAPNATGVVVERYAVLNTATAGDGIDIQRVSDSRVSNCYFFRTNVGLSIIGDRNQVSDLWAEECRAEGVAIGDSNPNYMTVNQTTIEVRRCVSVGCGTAWRGGGPPGWEIHGAGFCLPTPVGLLTEKVLLRECGAVPTGLSRYGAGISAPVSDVRFEECAFQGVEGAVRSLAPPGRVTLDRVSGLDPERPFSARALSLQPGTPARNPAPRDLLVFLVARVRRTPEGAMAATLGAQVAAPGQNAVAIPEVMVPQDASLPGMVVPMAVRVPAGGEFQVEVGGAEVFSSWGVLL